MDNDKHEKSIVPLEEYMVPSLINGEVDLKRYNNIPLGKLSSLGIGMTALTTAITNVVSEGAGSGLYWVTVPDGKTLVHFKNENAYMGSIKGPNGGVGGGQARLNQMPCDPTMIFMAATMYCVNMKLDAIQETQEEILQFLEQKEKAELRGNIIMLSDIIENYKYNWYNNQFVSSNHMKVLDIKQKSEQSILFAQSRINGILGKKKLIQISADVNAKVRKLNKAFEDYQLAMYSYAMSLYVETLLLRNFEKEYTDSIASKIDNYSISYRELYTDCYNALLQLGDKSVDSLLIVGLGKLSKAAGEAIAKVPVISKGELDESLIAAGDIVSESEEVIRKSRLSTLVSKQSSYVAPFVENIKMIGELHEKPLNVLFDKENLYFEKVAV